MRRSATRPCVHHDLMAAQRLVADQMKKYSIRTAAIHPPDFDAVNPRSVLVCNH
jgi:hypothetical protein